MGLYIQHADKMGNTSNQDKAMPDCMIERKSFPSIEDNSRCIAKTPNNYQINDSVGIELNSGFIPIRANQPIKI